MRQYGNTKTTIDIPEPLWRQAKIRAVEQSTSLKELILRGLAHELDSNPAMAGTTTPNVPYFARRKLLPAFQKLQESGALKPRPGDRDITDLLSEDREDRSR